MKWEVIFNCLKTIHQCDGDGTKQKTTSSKGHNEMLIKFVSFQMNRTEMFKKVIITIAFHLWRQTERKWNDATHASSSFILQKNFSPCRFSIANCSQ